MPTVFPMCHCRMLGCFGGYLSSKENYSFSTIQYPPFLRHSFQHRNYPTQQLIMGSNLSIPIALTVVGLFVGIPCLLLIPMGFNDCESGYAFHTTSVSLNLSDITSLIGYQRRRGERIRAEVEASPLSNARDRTNSEETLMHPPQSVKSIEDVEQGTRMNSAG